MYEEFKQLLISKLEIDPEQIKPEAQLANDLGINSLELADLVLYCEDKYGIEIEDDALQSFITVNDVVEYLTGLVENK
ncbi:MAG: acyl carrier protein [Clostridia bacterium]|nr:acyl carrier protein [Clostridia bacterium]MBP5208716.1 acyl carrier protein [Clostridia bacterium]